MLPLADDASLAESGARVAKRLAPAGLPGASGHPLSSDAMQPQERIERYELLGELATGGMATVYLGRQHGPLGFSRTVAIKSMHPQFAKDEDFRAMFLDEATLTSRIRHPNVVPTLDIVCAETRVLLVMEYIDGVSLSQLLRIMARRQRSMPPPIAVAILCDTLHGLQAAHDLVDEDGNPLSVVHRDVSPQNIHVGVDGLARVLDFGVAKAASRRYVTQSGEVKGKLAYMAGEQLCGEAVDRRTDIYAAGVVLWEALAGRRLFDASNEGELVKKVLEGRFEPPSFFADEPIPPALDLAVLKALSLKPEDRFATAEEMAQALTDALAPAPRTAITATVRELASKELESRAHRLREKTPGVQHLEPEAKALVHLLTEHATQTIATSSRTEPRRAARILVPVAIFTTLLLFMGVAFMVGSRMGRPPPTALVTPPSPSPSASAPALPQPPAGAAASPEPTPTAPAVTLSARRNPRRLPPAPPRSAAPAPKAPPRDCSPPFVVDAHGDRHYKPECVD